MRSLVEVEAIRERILECSFDILAREGYESLSMAKIGSRTNMTAANLYNYYGNKDELLIAVHKKGHVMLHDALRKAVRDTDSPLERFRKLAFAFVGFGIRNMHLYDIMFNRPVKQHRDYIGTPQEPLSTDEYQSSLRVLALAAEVIEECRPEGHAPEPFDARPLAVRCFSALHGIVSLYNSGVLAGITDDTETTLNEYTETIIRFVTG